MPSCLVAATCEILAFNSGSTLGALKVVVIIKPIKIKVAANTFRVFMALLLSSTSARGAQNSICAIAVAASHSHLASARCDEHDVQGKPFKRFANWLARISPG